MKNILKKLPVPIVGLMLGLVATGNLVLSYGGTYRNIFGVLSAILLLLILAKYILYPKDVKEALKNPVVASVFPTLSMGVMLLATYLKPFSSKFAFGLWIIGLILHIILIIVFTKNYVLNFNIKKVFSSWFVVYVGIVVASVSGPAFNMNYIGELTFWFGFIAYLVLLPIVLMRIFMIKEIPEAASPTLVILSAPASLCLAGYMSSFQEKNMFMIGLLLVLSQLTLFYVLTQLPKLLKLKFYPSYSAFTFPLVISAVSLKVTNGYFIKAGQPIGVLNYLVKFEEWLAIIMVLYVLIKYFNFLLAKPKNEADVLTNENKLIMKS